MDSNDVRREWAERSGEFSPEYYAYRGPDETSERIRTVLDREVGTDASVLELGCSAGRHLAHLADNGYDDLHGVDINEESFDVMAEAYPDLAETGTFYVDAIESVVERFDDDRFDAVYSVETLQHIHPDHDEVFGELTRIADDLVVTVENESGTEDEENVAADGVGDASDEAVNYVNDEFPLYYRDWNAVFTELGWAEIESVSADRDTLRAFRPA
ncbi:Methyltransferase domain-containing protein [Halogranum gelatinilyticum]|uniref:Methyltransferase domain-containing protein n=1 Tax=Halogranum gelatinilyticum TaxID=660521 RepID=A0A1G9U529_9EURY|nr:class I SAM-dependent methyltransferase [Halogranum gelatinilyticum]SDM54913.1 Methyltransferase domain-containing protein [Halogranum gelatinilyticum]